jgi:hypothetical protein
MIWIRFVRDFLISTLVWLVIMTVTHVAAWYTVNLPRWLPIPGREESYTKTLELLETVNSYSFAFVYLTTLAYEVITYLLLLRRNLLRRNKEPREDGNDGQS